MQNHLKFVHFDWLSKCLCEGQRMPEDPFELELLALENPSPPKMLAQKCKEIFVLLPNKRWLDKASEKLREEVAQEKQKIEETKR